MDNLGALMECYMLWKMIVASGGRKPVGVGASSEEELEDTVQLLASKRRRVYQPTVLIKQTFASPSSPLSLDPSSPASDLLHPRFSRPNFLQNFTKFSLSNW
ncbi:unnamed protein product [Lactuca virosa]|uniref:Uncharacterized protein n=1 Tax=Lactuca virosa TaxID=75947 RepID=A0AAU9NKK9_9ASTR|nr:unnamed protein product [Lactuca virosa]